MKQFHICYIKKGSKKAEGSNVEATCIESALEVFQSKNTEVEIIYVIDRKFINFNI